MIWSSQLRANDFPPVCAMTGRTAEAWRRFRFATPPQWAYALLLLACLGGLGFVLYALIVAAISRRASGYLPLTRTSRRWLNLFMWAVIAMLPLFIVLLVGGIAVGSNTNGSTQSAVSAILLLAALVALLAFLIGAVIRRFIGPSAKVMEPPPGYQEDLVELRRVHPAFVAAVQQAHRARAAQYASMQQPPAALPPVPGSN